MRLVFFVRLCCIESEMLRTIKPENCCFLPSILILWLGFRKEKNFIVKDFLLKDAPCFALFYYSTQRFILHHFPLSEAA